MNHSEQPEAAPFPARAKGDIDGWRVRLYFLSRDPHLLIWIAVIIIGIGVALGKMWQPEDPLAQLEKTMRDFHARMREAAQEGNVSRGRVDLGAELLKAKPDIGRVLTAIESCNRSEPQAITNVNLALQKANLALPERNLAFAYWQSLCSHLDEPGADLLYFASLAKPPAYANELVGDFAMHARQPERALACFTREIAMRPDDVMLRKKILSVHRQRNDLAAIAQLTRDPAYASLLDVRTRLFASMRGHDWKTVWATVLELQKDNYSDKIPIILTCIAGGVWLILTWQMGQPRGFFSFIIWAPLIAIPLGALSTLPVLFLDAYESEVWGLKHTGLFFQDCWFFLAGVGLREELCKLVAFLPFVPVLLMRKNRLETLLIAGAVGLGFAVEENVSYFRMSTPANAFARFLTANFFHLAATGLIGLSLCDSLRDLRKKWWHFPCMFIAVATAHGFYDAFISTPGKLFTTLGCSCFILLSLAFFRQMARERGPATDQLFPAATLTLGLSVLIAAIIATASMTLGLTLALITVLIGAVSLTLFVWMLFILFQYGLRDEEEPALSPAPAQN